MRIGVYVFSIADLPAPMQRLNGAWSGDCRSGVSEFVEIRRTRIYSVLTGILAAVFFGAIIVTQQMFRVATGQDSNVAIVMSTLLIAALFAPIRRRVQNVIDRRLYRRAYDVEQTLATFRKNLREDVDIDTLNANQIAVLDDTLQPTHITLWVKEPKA